MFIHGYVSLLAKFHIYRHMITVLFYFSSATKNLMANNEKKNQFFRSFLNVIKNNLAIREVIWKLQVLETFAKYK